MRESPHIARSACKYGIDPFDIQSVLNDPIDIIRMTEMEGGADRPNVDIYIGLGVYQQKVVVFVDRFENQAFHAEPGERNFGWMF